jgi:hypothetical protein
VKLNWHCLLETYCPAAILAVYEIVGLGSGAGSPCLSCCIRSAADRVRSSVSRAETVSRISAGVVVTVQRATHPDGLDSVRVVHLVGARRVLFSLVGGTGHAARDAPVIGRDRYVLKRRNSRLRPSEPR